MKSCATCEHFNQTSGANGSVSGECRAHPPLTVPVPVPTLTGGSRLGFTAGWSPVSEDQWCGEWLDANASEALKRVI